MARPAVELPQTSFLDPAVLAAIGNLELLARTVVDGFLHGLHRSARLGLSMEFAEHRPYMPGDDIRRIDWRVYGRTDRYYVKEYEAETNATVTFLLDGSGSMDFGTGGLTKFDYARYLTACLAWFSARQRDRVGLAVFGREVTDYVPPSTRHLRQILHVVDRARAAGVGALEPSLRQIAERAGRRGIMVLVSDFYEDPERVREAIGLLQGTGADLIVFQVLDPAERDLTDDVAAVFEDLETGERLPVVPEDQRAGYQALLRDHLAALEGVMAASRVDFAACDVAQPLDFALYHYLARRHQLRRAR